MPSCGIDIAAVSWPMDGADMDGADTATEGVPPNTGAWFAAFKTVTDTLFPTPARGVETNANSTRMPSITRLNRVSVELRLARAVKGSASNNASNASHETARRNARALIGNAFDQLRRSASEPPPLGEA